MNRPSNPRPGEEASVDSDAGAAAGDALEGDTTSTTDEAELLRQLAKHAPAVLWVEAYEDSQPSKAIPLWYSEGSEAVTGYRAHEWFDDPELWLKIIHPEDQQRVATATWEASMRGGPFSSDFRIVKPDGRMVFVREKATVVRDDEHGRELWYGVTMDLGEREFE